MDNVYSAGLPQEALHFMARIVLGREFHEDAVNPKTNPKYQFSFAPCGCLGVYES